MNEMSNDTVHTMPATLSQFEAFGIVLKSVHAPVSIACVVQEMGANKLSE